MRQRAPWRNASTRVEEPPGPVKVTEAVAASPKSIQGRNAHSSQNHSTFSGSSGAAGSRTPLMLRSMKRGSSPASP